MHWEHMLNQKNGELLIDIGILFTPKSSCPVVGLWRLDALEEFYIVTGFNLETIHHHCMLYRYAASQAEMPQDHAHKEYESTVKVLQSAKTKTYGVRDEYRVSGQAAQILLRNALNSSLENSLGWLTTLQESYFDQSIYTHRSDKD